MALAEQSDIVHSVQEPVDVARLERTARTQEKIGFAGLLPALASAVWLCESGSPEAAALFGTIVTLICCFTFLLPEKNRGRIHAAEIEYEFLHPEEE